MSRKTEPAAAVPTRALDRGLRMLEALAEGAPMTLVEVAAMCGLSPATASRILSTLEARGYVVRERDTRAYRIGLTSFEVGSRFLSGTRLSETCTLILRRLTAATGQTTTLAILNRADIVYVDACEGTSPLRSMPQIGMRAPAHASASGKCLLAAMWGDGLSGAVGPGPFEAMTERTITTAETLMRELTTLRRTGVAIEHGELHADISCVACQIRNRTGAVIAAIAIQASASQMTANAEAWVPALQAAAAEASLRLGWRDRVRTADRPSTSQLTD